MTKWLSLCEYTMLYVTMEEHWGTCQYWALNLYTDLDNCQLSMKESGGHGRKYWQRLILFKGLRICMSEKQLGNTQAVPKKKEKRGSCSKDNILEKNQSSGLIQDGSSRWPVVWITDVRWSGRWSGYVNIPSSVLQTAVHRVCRHLQALTQDRKFRSGVPRLVKGRRESCPHASAYLILEI